MSMERLHDLRTKASQEAHDKSMQGIEWVAGTRPAKRAMRGVSGYLIESGIGLFSYDGLTDAIEQTQSFLETGHKLIILSSHKSHGEIAPAIHIMEEFMRENPDYLEEMVIPVAKSMAEGQQGNIVKTLYGEALVPNTKTRKIKTLPVVTDNDVIKRGMSPNPMANGMAIARELKKDKSGFFIFIEGSVQGGRTNLQTGEICGLQEPDSMLERLLEYSKKSGKPLAFVPVGIENSHNLFSAEGKFFTPQWIKAMAAHQTGSNKTIASVHVGTPISTCGMNLENTAQAAENLMIAIASNLPLHERGMYKGVEYLLNT